MKTRRRQGATLGLVAVCVLVIIVVGIGCFFLAKIFGGGREVANATDAGALNIAKNAMKKNDPLARVAVALTGTPEYADFKYCADPINSNEINLMTYNRCVAQALLVAMNAEQETTNGASQANPHATTVLQNLNKLGQSLNDKLTDKKIVSFFSAVANDTRMWGNNGVNAQDQTLVSRYMKHGESTNVYFTGASIAGLTLPGNWSSKGANKLPPSSSTGSYLRGYEALNVPGVGSIMGVPVFPQQNPHLVSLADFQKAPDSDAPSTNVPPNSFSIATSSKEGKTGLMGGAVAAAIIGASMSNSGGGAANFQFPAAIPGGYLEIENLQSGPVPANAFPVDNSDNIFNNELYVGPGIQMGSTSSGPVFFSTDTSAPSAWAAYNTSTSSLPGGVGGDNTTTYVLDTAHAPRNKKLWPPDLGHPEGNMYIATTPGKSQAAAPGNAAEAALLTLTNATGTNCLHDAGQLDATGELHGSCQSYLPSFENAYSPPPSGQATNPGQYSNVDVLKGQVIGAFQSGNQSVQVPNSALPPSGLGVYNQNGFGISPEPTYTAPLQEPGSIDALLNQVTTGPNANCTKSLILNQMTQRCFEIKPDAVPADVQNLWTRQIPMGTTLYVYLNTATNKLDILAAGKPPTYTGVKPDGVPTGTANGCFNKYGLDNIFVNVPKGATEADLDLHDRPYRSASGGLSAEDHANFTLSSGFNNLLGKLQFSNQVQGVENFSRPN